MGDDCTIWFNAVIRGDVNSIRIGNSVNIQDGAVIHCNYKDSVSLSEIMYRLAIMQLFMVQLLKKESYWDGGHSNGPCYSEKE